ncbi:MAG: outer membrane beta-barrel protein [Bacteroidales bacterium]|jgi:hypothetical protein|nr:outer membrane beta-barrel protein [Bacteroidales bacterium]
MKKFVFIIIILLPVLSLAQQPKMDIKLFAGVNTSTFVYKVEDVEPDILAGWQAGGGFRISKKKAFVEIDFTYIEYALSFLLIEETDSLPAETFDVRIRAFEIPLTIGYVPVKTPVFKWYLYGGLVNRFSLSGRFTYNGETEKFKPSDLQLHTYNLGARFGTQIDIAMFNFDFNYTIGVTNALKEKIRTNSHALQLSVGILF